jgi:hypothetical protein
VIFTALLLAQLAPASTVTDELGLGEPVLDGFELLAALAPADVAAAGVLELPPLLHAARPVTAARAAVAPSASCGRLLLAVVPVLSLFIGGELLCFFFSECARSGARAGKL